VLRFTAEGLESRHGVSVKPVRLGWLGTVNFEGDEFRQSMLGRAAYKALGEVLNELYDRFPLMGSVLYAGGSSLVLDIGQDSGLRLGDELNVYRMQALADDSGKPVWTDEERVGSARVVEFQDGRALCLVLDGQESITAGDIVHRRSALAATFRPRGSRGSRAGTSRRTGCRASPPGAIARTERCARRGAA
jgi:hypothetical protein